MKKGLLCVIGASLLFGIVPSANKYVMLGGISAEDTTFWGQCTICALSYLLLRLQRGRPAVPPRDAARLMLVGAVGMGATTFLLNSACRLIAVGLATVLHFLYPSVVSVAMVLFFGQAMTKHKAVAIVCSVAGMCLIAGLQGSGGGRLLGAVLALLSGLTYAFYIIANDKGAVSAYPLLVKLFYASAGSAVLMSVPALAGGGLSFPKGPAAAAALFGVCGAGCLTAFYLITAGIRRIGAGTASFVNMLEPVTSVVVGTLLYRDRLTPAMALGILLVLFSVFLAALDGRGRAGAGK